jgi:hypothetical protein
VGRPATRAALQGQAGKPAVKKIVTDKRNDRTLPNVNEEVIVRS